MGAATLGMDCKLYYCDAGIGGTPSWTEITNATGVKLNLSKGEADVTVRGNNGWKATVGTLKDGSVDFEMIWDATDAVFAALLAAWLDDTVIGFAVMDGDVTDAAAQGLWADMAVINFSRDEPLDGPAKASVTIKPTYSANAPVWKPEA